MAASEMATINEDGEVELPQPRRRGRPPKSESTSAAAAAAEAAADPNSPAGDPGAAAKPRRRKNRAAPKAEELDAIAKRIYGLHMILGALLKAPEFILAPEECMTLAATSAEIAREFDIEVGGRWAVVGSAVAAVGAIYIPRIIKVSMRMQADRKAAEDRNTVDAEIVNQPDASSNPAYNGAAEHGVHSAL